MQSHTCTASGSLLFWCDSVWLEAVGSRSLSCLVHRRPFPALVTLGCYTKVVTHEGTGSGTCIFYKRKYGEAYYNTLPIGYPLSSLLM